VYVCVLFAIAAGLSRPWIANTLGTAGPRVRRLGWWCAALVFAQLTIAATMRHNYAGMAIPTFPYSTAGGALLPASWDYRVALQFAHRVMAAVIGVGILTYGHFLFREKSLTPWLRLASLLLVGLVGLQILLGAQIIWTGRSVLMTTGHVLTGALTFATTFVVAFFTYRSSIERPTT
jgi:cytochrome c oxidase assembly protein subunit 15